MLCPARNVHAQQLFPDIDSIIRLSPSSTSRPAGFISRQWHNHLDSCNGPRSPHYTRRSFDLSKTNYVGFVMITQPVPGPSISQTRLELSASNSGVTSKKWVAMTAIDHVRQTMRILYDPFRVIAVLPRIAADYRPMSHNPCHCRQCFQVQGHNASNQLRQDDQPQFLFQANQRRRLYENLP